MGRIFFCGDVHGNFKHVIKAVREHRPAAVVFLGDLQPQRPIDQELRHILNLTEIWWIHGNHDTDSQVDHDNEICAGDFDKRRTCRQGMAGKAQ